MEILYLYLKSNIMRRQGYASTISYKFHPLKRQVKGAFQYKYPLLPALENPSGSYDARGVALDLKRNVYTCKMTHL